MTQRKILVTSALPYANGHIHIGHLVEYIQTDIWVRFQKLRGNRCLYICADDTHGTAITLRARREGRSEEAVIADMHEAHARDFTGFGVAFDHYGSTNSEANREICGEIWQAIRDAGLVKEKTIEQLFDPEANTFLADRFVQGTCPKCKSPDQYGDNCDACGATYSPAELIEPRSTLSGATPEVRSANHLFIELEKLHPFLETWTQEEDHLQKEVANYLKGHFLHEPLRDWDISRPGPYFGFEIPESPGNYWYVWFDAPIGYIASTKEWCDANGENVEDWWRPPIACSEEVATEIHHFLGKDITYFHTLFWPGMLKTAGYNLPERVHIHGFLTVGGQKMSKSKGTFIMASTYLNHLNPAYLRYYYASKLGARLDDIDLNLEEFITKINSDLVGKVVNLASRSAKFVQGETLSETYPDDGGLFAAAAKAGESIAQRYEKCEYHAAMREIMALADAANRYVETNEPWKLKKEPERKEELRAICSVTLNLFRQIAIYLAPVLPELAEQMSELLGSPIQHWSDAQTPLAGTSVAKFKHMLKRVTPEQVEKMTEETQAAQAEAEKAEAMASLPQYDDGPEALEAEPLTEECTFDEFVKSDLRIARIVVAEEVPEARKLLKLTLSLGGDVRKTVFAGIKASYSPEELQGRLVIFAANLAPRKMRFGISEGMVLAAGPGKEAYLLAVDEGAVPGQRVH